MQGPSGGSVNFYWRGGKRRGGDYFNTPNYVVVGLAVVRALWSQDAPLFGVEEVIEGKKRKGSHHVKLGGRAILYGELARVCI